MQTSRFSWQTARRQVDLVRKFSSQTARRQVDLVRRQADLVHRRADLVRRQADLVHRRADLVRRQARNLIVCELSVCLRKYALSKTDYAFELIICLRDLVACLPNPGHLKLRCPVQTQTCAYMPISGPPQYQ